MYNLLVVRKTFIARLTTSSVSMCRVLGRVNIVQPTRVVNMSQQIIYRRASHTTLKIVFFLISKISIFLIGEHIIDFLIKC